MAGDPRKFAELMRNEGYSDDDIVAALQKVKQAAPPPVGHMGRGDELFTEADKKEAEVGARPPIETLGKLGPFPAASMLPLVDKTNPREVSQLEDAHNFVKLMGGQVGGALGGAVTEGVPLVGRLMAGGAPSRILGSAITGAGAGLGATAGTGEVSPPELAKGAAMGGLISGGAATVGEMLAGAGRAVRNSKGGLARQLIEKHGGNVGPMNSGSGIPELDGLKTVTDADIGAQARASGKQLLQANDRLFDQEGRQPYLAARAAIDQGPGQRMIDVTPLKDKMLEVAYDKSTDPGTKSWLLNQADIIEKHHTGPMGMSVMSEKDVNGLKSMLQQSSNPGLAPGAGSIRDAKIGSVADVAKAIVDQGPYAQANADYAAAKTRSGDFREGFGMARKPAANEQVDERRIANALARRGQTTTTAGIQGGDQRLAQLEQAYPKLQRSIAAPQIVKAKGDLQFGLGHTGGLIDRMPSKHLVVDLARQNIPALAGRFAYGPAGAAQGVGQALAGAAVPTAQMLVTAAQMKRQHDAAVVDAIFGAGRGKPGPDDKQAPQQQGP